MTELRGYVRGLQAAARYCGINDRQTFRTWCRDFKIRPRLIHGQAYFKLSALDALMDPDRNAPGSEEEFWHDSPPSPGTQSAAVAEGTCNLRRSS